MAKRDPRIDKYIAKSPDFAKPILIHAAFVPLKGKRFKVSAQIGVEQIGRGGLPSLP